jgi:SAM-dependent methyltransferase
MVSTEQRYAHDYADEWMTSPRAVLPRLRDLARFSSVLDVGCGPGYWLRACEELGVSDVMGIDGPWVDQSKLLVDRSRFVVHNLEASFDLGRTFDFVISLEVAEHVSPEASGRLVDSLTRHGDVLLFGAAIPGQGGQNHLCERWPSYWADLFQARGYSVLDVVRPLFWDDPRVLWWYRQNMLLVVNDRGRSRVRLPPLEELIKPRALVHPTLFGSALFRSASRGIGTRVRAFLRPSRRQ